MKAMKNLQEALRAQRKVLESLKKYKIYFLRGFGLKQILVFGKLLHIPNERPSHYLTQKLIDDG